VCLDGRLSPSPVIVSSEYSCSHPIYAATAASMSYFAAKPVSCRRPCDVLQDELHRQLTAEI
jgi:hypothetical protein